jgi:oligopeptide transport system permease protein
MATLILRRLLALPLVLLAIYTISFALVATVPGSAVIGEKNLDPVTRANKEAQLGLDKPAVVRYFWYLGKLARGDMGVSAFYDRSVTDVIASSLPVSLMLGSVALALAVLAGMGIVAAVRHNRPADYVLTGIASLGVSIPNVVLALLLLLVFAYHLRWLPVGGWGQSRSQLVLPAIALAAPYVAYIARLTRASMLDVLAADYVRTARAKGASGPTVVLEHGLPNAFLPVLAFLGPAAASIFTGSLVVEKVFNIPGIGQHIVDGAQNRDWMLVLGLALTYSALLLVFNLLVDVGYVALEPRMRTADA